MITSLVMKIYKAIPFFIFLALHGGLVLGQSPVTSGLRAGVSLADLHGADVTQGQPLAAFQGGVFVDYALTPSLSLHPEANLAFKGATHDVSINGFPFSKASVSYLQVPVLLKYTSPTAWRGAAKPTLFLGPALNLNITKDLEGQILDDVPGSFSVDQQVKTLSYGLVVGLGATVRDVYVVDIRYDYGLSNIFEQGDIRSSSIVLSVGFIF